VQELYRAAGHSAPWQDRFPLCAGCLDLLLADPQAFWQPLRQGRGG
jgi:hypothetical protein